MKTLSEHNASSRLIVYFYRPGDLTGVTCDECGDELRYVTGTPISANPARSEVLCHGCGCMGIKVGAGEDEVLQLIA